MLKNEKIILMWATLKEISKYQSPEKLRRQSEKQYGLSYEEALEMAYENVIEAAKRAVAGIKKPNI